MMNALDILFLALIIFLTLLGFYWGLIRQVLALAGLLVGVIVAGRFGPVVAAWLSSFVADALLADALGFVLVVLFVSVVASLVASILRLFVGLLFLGQFDHLAGGVLGLLQGLLASTVVLVTMVTFQVPAWDQLLESSRLAGPLLRISEPVTMLLPEVFRLAVQAALEQ